MCLNKCLITDYVCWLVRFPTSFMYDYIGSFPILILFLFRYSSCPKSCRGPEGPTLQRNTFTLQLLLEEKGNLEFSQG